jgi:DNA (cytosine-5)-methyltransferase 1
MRIKVTELFASVSGFRLGLEKSNFEVVWSNQYEPGTPNTQHASKVYVSNFGAVNHSKKFIYL